MGCSCGKVRQGQYVGWPRKSPQETVDREGQRAGAQSGDAGGWVRGITGEGSQGRGPFPADVHKSMSLHCPRLREAE